MSHGMLAAHQQHPRWQLPGLWHWLPPHQWPWRPLAPSPASPRGPAAVPARLARVRALPHLPVQLQQMQTLPLLWRCEEGGLEGKGQWRAVKAA